MGRACKIHTEKSPAGQQIQTQNLAGKVKVLTTANNHILSTIRGQELKMLIHTMNSKN